MISWINLSVVCWYLKSYFVKNFVYSFETNNFEFELDIAFSWFNNNLLIRLCFCGTSIHKSMPCNWNLFFINGTINPVHIEFAFHAQSIVCQQTFFLLDHILAHVPTFIFKHLFLWIQIWHRWVPKVLWTVLHIFEINQIKVFLISICFQYFLNFLSADSVI